MSGAILILGGYGVFGGKLARRLLSAGADVIVAGRSMDKAQTFCAAHSGRPLVLDRDGDLATTLGQVKPLIVIDAAGPFQAYGGDPYRVARAAITAGAHYLDLADDAAFVAGIGALDAEAKATGVVVRSGASSVPSISAAALDELTKGLAEVAVVSSMILPGNRAPRGLSVIRAIVGQVGRPLAFWRGGHWRDEPAWGDLKRVGLEVDTAKVSHRLASCIDAPDRLLFPTRYNARSALFHAGLELKLMHVGLWLLGWLVRLKLVSSLTPFSSALRWIAERLEPFGTDRGGMVCTAIGRDEHGKPVERSWTLIAEGGDGPEIPPTPAALLALKLLGQAPLKPGACPAVDELTLTEIEAGLSHLRVVSGREEKPAPTLFEQVLPDDFDALPYAWRRLADVQDVESFSGRASVERGTGFLSRIAGWINGFPPAINDTPVTVTKFKTSHGETWLRNFGGRTFQSHLSAGNRPGLLYERFGPFRFSIELTPRDGKVFWPLIGWTALGIPMPRALCPHSMTLEEVDAGGVFHFDVSITLPLAGHLVRYRGWLKPGTPDSR